MRKFSNVAATFVSNDFWKQIPLIGKSIAFAFTVALIPTGMYKNLGYVDPNMYVGYGVNLSWLVDYVGYEYHATRLPLIFLITFLLEFPPFLFGFLFKFTCLLIIALSWFYTCQNFNIAKSNSYLGAFILLLSPLSISSSSWTFPNSFAMIIGITLIPIITKVEHSRRDFYLIGFVLTNVAIMNVFFAVLTGVLIIPLLYRQKMAIMMISIFRIITGSVITWIAFEFVWRFILGFSGSMYKPQINAIFAVDSISDEYWKPINYIVANRPLAVIFISFVSISIIVNTSLYLLITKKKRATNIRVLIASNALFSFTIVLLYLFKVFIGFSELWYFYIVFFSYFIAIILISVSSNRVINSILPKILAFGTLLFYLKLQLEFDPKLQSTIILITFLFVFLAVQHMIDSTKKYPKEKVPFHLALLFVGTVVSWNLLFLNPTLQNSYSWSDNQANTRYLKNQIWLVGKMESLGLTAKKVALYAAPDPSGLLGGLESTLSFHLMRLDGRNAVSPEINLDNWVQSRGEKPDAIIVLLDSDTQSNPMNVGFLSVKVPGYCSVGYELFPELNKKFTILKKEGSC